MLLLLGLAVVGCARYAPRALEPPGPTSWEVRRLDDPRVLAALDSSGGERRPLNTWDDAELAHAAWIISPARARAEAEVSAARAAIAAIGQRASPGLSTETEFSFSGRDGSSRWGIAVAGLFRLGLGGKRDARRAAGEAAWLVAAAESAQEGWELGSRVRLAARRAAAAAAVAAAGRDISAAQDTAVAAAHARFEAGTIGRLELARLLADQEAGRSEAAALEREAATARARLAEAAGIPLAALEPLEGLRISVAACPPPGDRSGLLAQALEQRWDLRVEVARYQVAEAELRLEVARSWPDLDLGPGIFFDHGVGKWILGFGLPDLVLHGNRASIRHAEARRAVAAARVREVGERVLNEVEAALSQCAAALAERDAVDPVSVARRVAGTEEAYSRGEVGRLEVALARVEQARLERRIRVLDGGVGVAGAEMMQALGGWPPQD